MLVFIAYTFAALVALLILTIGGASFLVCWFGGSLSAWVQSLGAILAIVTGFAAAIWQVWAQRMEARQEQCAVVKAAHILASEALATTSDRLDAALIPPNSGKCMSLRGDRTTEMVLAMREFDTKKLPADLLPLFVRIRSHVFAINERISDVYDTEKKNQELVKKRGKRLKSAESVRDNARKLLDVWKETATH